MVTSNESSPSRRRAIAKWGVWDSGLLEIERKEIDEQAGLVRQALQVLCPAHRPGEYLVLGPPFLRRRHSLNKQATIPNSHGTVVAAYPSIPYVGQYAGEDYGVFCELLFISAK